MSRAERTSLFVYNAGVIGKLVGTGSFKGQEWMLSAGTFNIGRDPTCDLVLATEPGVSKIHCKITLENNQYLLADNESRNGTLVNKAVIKTAVLKDGDEVRICNAIFRFEQEMAMPDRPDKPSKPAAKAPTPPPVEEMTDRVSARRAAGNPVVKPVRTWPYFMLGFLLFFGMAGGTAHMLGLIPPLETLRAQIPILLPAPPPDAPQAGTTTPPPPAASPTPVEAAPSETPTPATAEEKPVAAIEKPVELPAEKAPEQKVEKPAEIEKAPEEAVGEEIKGVVKVEKGGGGNTVNVKHSTNGRVANVNVRDGQKVKRGQTLLTYEDVETVRQLETARENCRSLREIAEARDDERVRKALKECNQDVARKESQLSSSKLGAPCEGTISDVNAAAGKRAGKGTGAFKISCGGGGGVVTVSAVVPTDSAKGIKNGTRATVNIDDQNYDGEVSDVTSMPSGLRVVLSLERAPAKANEGDSARIRFKQ